jgi:hypothetical protein
MPHDIHANLPIIFAVGVSIFGSIMALMLALYPTTTQGSLPWRKPLIGSIFALICISGIMAVFFPEKCSESFHSHKTEKTTISKARNSSFQGASVTLEGHHPDCGRFSMHIVRVDRHVFCAACTGLFLGALVSVLGTSLYFFGEWRLEEASLPAVFIGIAGVILGLLQLKFGGFVRLMLNAYFVLGTFLVLAGVDELRQSLFADLFLIALIVFWLFSRIALSQWDHWRICQDCKSYCQFYRLKEKKVLESSTQSVKGADDDQYSEDNYRKRPYVHFCGNYVCLLHNPYAPGKQNYYANSYADNCAASWNSEAFLFYSSIGFPAPVCSEAFPFCSPLSLFFTCRIQRRSAFGAHFSIVWILGATLNTVNHLCCLQLLIHR